MVRLLLLLTLAACSTHRAYDGPRRARADRSTLRVKRHGGLRARIDARIVGVDGKKVDYAKSVEVASGAHTVMLKWEWKSGSYLADFGSALVNVALKGSLSPSSSRSRKEGVVTINMVAVGGHDYALHWKLPKKLPKEPLLISTTTPHFVRE